MPPPHLAPALLLALTPPLVRLCRHALWRLIVCRAHPLVELLAVCEPAGVDVPGPARRAARRRRRGRRRRRHPLIIRVGQVQPVHARAAALDLLAREMGAGEGGVQPESAARAAAGGSSRQQQAGSSCSSPHSTSSSQLQATALLAGPCRTSSVRASGCESSNGSGPSPAGCTTCVAPLSPCDTSPLSARTASCSLGAAAPQAGCTYTTGVRT